MQTLRGEKYRFRWARTRAIFLDACVSQWRMQRLQSQFHEKSCLTPHLRVRCPSSFCRGVY